MSLVPRLRRPRAPVPDLTPMTDAYPPFRLDMGGDEPMPATCGVDIVTPTPTPGLSS